MDIKSPLAKLAGIGSILAKKLEKLNLYTIEDLLTHYPFRYEDLSKIVDISQAQIGDKVTIAGEIWQINNTYTKFKKVLTKAVLNDGTGSIVLTWFNQPYLTKSLKTGDKVQIAGTIVSNNGKAAMIAPDWEKINNGPGIHTGRLVPIYPETAGVSSKWLRSLIFQFLINQKQIPDYLPPEVIDKMLPLVSAINKIHFPENFKSVYLARERLGFDELFLLQLSALQTRHLWNEKTLIKPWKIDPKELKKFTAKLPFELTNAQNKVLEELLLDLKKQHPMNRLVQGEVGSGKTVVAAAVIYLAYNNGFQSLIMAPTEILAIQHYNTLKKLLEPFGISVGIYTGSKKFNKGNELSSKYYRNNEQKNPKDLIHNTNPNVIVGTHALLSEKLKLEKIGLVVIDEQHRFGVEQRTILRQKGLPAGRSGRQGDAPHFLTMTATPIPRTVALTLYGDLDISIIDEMPKNRQLVKTHVVPETKRQDAYKFIQKKITEGDQAYVITPLIEEPDLPAGRSGRQELKSAKAATVEFERLKKIFPKLKLGLLHGKMKPKEKEQVLEDFRLGQIQILVSTSVVEVGVDVPNATIMVIEGAERFGLAQLHQLRGRVGRGAKQSFCLLFSTDGDPKENTRLKHLESTFNGLKLAELDLKTRGSGTIFGTAQHGRIDLKIAQMTDLDLIQNSRKAAQKILAIDPTLDKYPPLKGKLTSISGNVMPD